MEANKKEYIEGRSVTGLFAELTREITSLMRYEIALTRTELSEKISQVQTGVISLAAGALCAYAGLLVLLAAAVIGLSNVWPAWLAALAVGLIVGVLGLILLASGRSRLKAQSMKPEKATGSLRHDWKMMKEHVR